MMRRPSCRPSMRRFRYIVAAPRTASSSSSSVRSKPKMAGLPVSVARLNSSAGLSNTQPYSRLGFRGAGEHEQCLWFHSRCSGVRQRDGRSRVCMYRRHAVTIGSVSRCLSIAVRTSLSIGSWLFSLAQLCMKSATVSCAVSITSLRGRAALAARCSSSSTV